MDAKNSTGIALASQFCHNKAMAELSESDVRQISSMFSMMNEIRTAVTDTRNVTRDIRTNTVSLVQTASNTTLQTTLNDVRNSVNTIRNSASRINDLMGIMAAANNNFTAIQQLLARIDANTQSGPMVSGHLDQLRASVGGMQVFLNSMEQFMSELSAYIQDMHVQVIKLQSEQESKQKR